jgi:hypothetical protein
MPACHIGGMSQTTQQQQQYKKKCTRCGSEILMSNASGKWKALETDGATSHECSNKNTRNSINNNNNSDIGKPEDRPIGFTMDNNGNNGNNEQSSQQQQSQQAAVVYPVSVKLEVDSKGYVKPSVHLYGFDADKTASETVRLFFEVKSHIVERGGKVLEV